MVYVSQQRSTFIDLIYEHVYHLQLSQEWQDTGFTAFSSLW